MRKTRKNGRTTRNPSYKRYAQVIAKHKERLVDRYNIKEIGIFGSYVRGEQKKGSDLDILVDYEVVPGLLSFINLENYLTELLKTRVDLVDKEGLRPELRDAILREVVLL